MSTTLIVFLILVLKCHILEFLFLVLLLDIMDRLKVDPIL
jgi:hypothetical protein